MDQEEVLKAVEEKDIQYIRVEYLDFTSILRCRAVMRQYLKSAFENGDSTASLIVSGQVAGLIDEIKPARKIIEDIISEAETLVKRLNSIIY